MERKFLEGLGLEKEAIDKVLDEHSRAIGKQKSVIDELAEEKERLATQVEQVKRGAQVRTFLAGVKFVNEETREFYAARLDAALADEANAGKGQDELLAELTKGRDNVFAAEAPKKNTAVLPPVGNVDAGKGNNPFRQETWNMTEQARLYREDPNRAKLLAKEAGQKIF